MERIACTNCPLRKFSLFRESLKEEIDFIAAFKRGELHVDANSTLLHEGTSAPHLYTVLSGWAYRSKTTVDGRLQILNFVLPGDLIGLQTAILGEMDHSVTALTPMRLCVFERKDVWEIFKLHPSLAFSMTWQASKEERILDQTLLSVGQQTGLKKVALLMLHLFDRAKALGQAKGEACALPLTQTHIAQALGLTNVHVSRMLTLLARRKLIEFRNGTLTLLDRAAAEALSGYSGSPEAERKPIL